MKRGIFNEYVDAVLDIFEIKRSQLFKKSKRRDIVDARHLLYYMCYHRPMQVNYIQMFMKENGYKVGHSTIIHGISQVSDKMDEDTDYQQVYRTLSAVGNV